MQQLLGKLSIEKKDVILLIGDFNVDLLLYETHNQSRGFLDKMLSASLKPHIITPTFFLKLRFTLCKAEQPLQGMELQEKELQLD